MMRMTLIFILMAVISVIAPQTSNGQQTERDTKASTVVETTPIQVIEQEQEVERSEEDIEVFVCGYSVKGTCVDNTMAAKYTHMPTTTITLSVRHHRGRLLYFDSFRTKIKEFQDSQGMNLLGTARQSRSLGEPSFRQEHGQTRFAQSAGQYMIIRMDARVTPSPRSREVFLVGDFYFQEATDLQSFSFENFTFEEGRELQFADCKISVEKGEKQTQPAPNKAIFGGKRGVPYTLYVENQSPMRVESIRFVTANGIMDVEPVSRGMSRSNNRVSGRLGVLIPEDAGPGKLEIAYWTSTAKVKVPFDLTITAGL